MFGVLKTVLPVLVMLGLGMICKKTNCVSRSCIDGLKFLVVKIMLPVAVFHGLATATYGSYTVITVGILFAVMGITFVLGFVLRPLLPAPYSKYLPFLTAVYEGGMIAYPLYASLVGTENLSLMVMIDISGLLFCFGVFCNVLTFIEDGAKVSVKGIAVTALKNPAFVATILGVIVGLCGWIPALMESSFGPAYMGVKDMLTAAMSPMILLVVGYDFEISRESVKPCLITIALRAVLQGFFCFMVLSLLHKTVGSNHLLDVAIIIYMSAPGSFGIQTFLKSEQGAKYLASCNSLYMVLTICVYAIMSIA